MKRLALLLTVTLLSALTAYQSSAEKVKIQLPSDDIAFKPGTGIEMALANCVACHSTDYLAMQPPMPAKFWKAEVVKMQQKYGAAIQDAQVQALTDYLTGAYGVPDKK